VKPEIEAPELHAYADAFRASPELCEVAEIGGATCLAFRRAPERTFCRVMGLQSIEPLDEIAAFYGETPWWVSDSHGLAPELEARGFIRDYGWMKFTRGIGAREAYSDLDVRVVGPVHADDFATVVAGGYGMPDWAKPLAANVVGRPGWSCFVAYADGSPAGAGALYVHEGPGLGRGAGLGPAPLPAKVGWLGFAATLAEFRSRGAQSAILAARIEEARRQRCTSVTTETGELEEGRPSNSYRNITRAGFSQAGVRANYRAG